MFADLASNSPNEHLETRRVALVGVAPNDLENISARDDATIAPRKQKDEIELAWRERHRVASFRDRAPLSVDHEIAEGAARFGQARAATAERPDAGEQLLDGEGLAEVVVAAGVEPGDAIGDAVSRRENEHRNIDAPGARGATKIETRPIRQAYVDDGELEVRELGACFGARGCERDRVPDLSKGARDQRGEPFIVLDQQRAHTPSLVSRSAARTSPRRSSNSA
ncbi:MAG TPA: hypothetical protein VGH28_26770 [Polyangiaceae bacterium]